MVSKTEANRLANPTDYMQLTTHDGAMVVQLRNDMDRDDAIRGLRHMADRLVLLAEEEMA